jgi:hypothetical protein
MNAKPTGILALMPSRGAVSIETMLRLREHLDGYPSRLKVAFRKDVVTARNELAKYARDIEPASLDFDPEFVLLTDDDAWWPQGHVERAVQIFEANPNVDMIVGTHCARTVCQSPNLVLLEPAPPLFETAQMTVEELKELADAETKSGKRTYSDYREFVDEINGHDRTTFYAYRHEDGELVPLRYGGVHWAMMRRSLLGRVGEKPFDLIRPVPDDFPKEVFVNIRDFLCKDSAFYKRAIEAGATIVTERNLLVGHVDVGSGLMYFPMTQRPYKSKGLLVPTETADDVVRTGAARRYFEHEAANVWRFDVPKATA